MVLARQIGQVKTSVCTLAESKNNSVKQIRLKKLIGLTTDRVQQQSFILQVSPQKQGKRRYKLRN
jgi:hypothetical protein